MFCLMFFVMLNEMYYCLLRNMLFYFVIFFGFFQVVNFEEFVFYSFSWINVCIGENFFK